MGAGDGAAARQGGHRQGAGRGTGGAHGAGVDTGSPPRTPRRRSLRTSPSRQQRCCDGTYTRGRTRPAAQRGPNTSFAASAPGSSSGATCSSPSRPRPLRRSGLLTVARGGLRHRVGVTRLRDYRQRLLGAHSRSRHILNLLLILLLLLRLRLQHILYRLRSQHHLLLKPLPHQQHVAHISCDSV